MVRYARGVATIDELLQRVRANPGDDQARLILADALLEANDPMGAFITLQFKAAAEKCTRGELQHAADLLLTHLRHWLGPLASCVHRRSSRFDKGFLSHATIVFGALKPDQFAAIHASPVWATVTSAQLKSTEPAGVEACLTSPHLTHLTALACSQPALALLEPMQLPFTLKQLTVTVAINEVPAFMRNRAWNSLDTFRLESQLEHTSVIDAAHFARACGAARLEVNLAHHTDDDWVAALARGWTSAPMPRVVRVEFPVNQGAVNLTATSFELESPASKLQHVAAHLVDLDGLIQPRASARVVAAPGGPTLFEGTGPALLKALEQLS